MATKQIKFKSFGEMIYYIFRKKNCPTCENNLKKIKKEVNKGFQCWNVGLGEYRFGKLVELNISYYCSKCKEIRSLSEIYDKVREKV
ncbi:hypothetical protein AB2T96_12950 [Clostridium butyricum]|uniref:hypothetical protein n=1 Tax=Clostridium TaxID=1485 RepID=UPI0018A95494|nr:MULTISPECIES: hypothetical protein [Clostridium]MBS4843174.1 hypothetical protein [Clostridium sp.]MDB2162446.1 hypothetical protein [Clostridium butyricum]MDU1404301.1 hypothetical protein [Clostridium sp.]MDU4928325.1 hypothetical protein [Clostridium sp.]